jgi:hypothetical protein
MASRREMTRDAGRDLAAPRVEHGRRVVRQHVVDPQADLLDGVEGISVLAPEPVDPGLDGAAAGRAPAAGEAAGRFRRRLEDRHLDIGRRAQGGSGAVAGPTAADDDDLLRRGAPQRWCPYALLRHEGDATGREAEHAHSHVSSHQIHGPEPSPK